MYRESDRFHFQHRGKTIFFQWLIKARQKRRLMIIVNERFNRIQRNTLRSVMNLATNLLESSAVH